MGQISRKHVRFIAEQPKILFLCVYMPSTIYKEIKIWFYLKNSHSITSFHIVLFIYEEYMKKILSIYST